MVDTVRTLTALQTILADNTSGDISAQDLRDMLLSVHPGVVIAHTESELVTALAGSELTVVMPPETIALTSTLTVPTDKTLIGTDMYRTVLEGNFAAGDIIEVGGLACTNCPIYAKTVFLCACLKLVHCHPTDPIKPEAVPKITVTALAVRDDPGNS